MSVCLESSVFGVCELAYGRIGPTEARLILIAGNLALAGATLAGVPADSIAWITNGIAAALTAGMVAVLTARFGRNLKRLAEAEPVSRAGQAGRV